MAIVSRTAEQKTNHLGFPKPGELIEMTGTHALEASDRAILNLLYQHAHDSGKLLEQNAEWEIPLATVRQAFSRHESSDRLRDSLTRLMSVKVNVAYVADIGDGLEGPEQRVVITGLFDFFDVSAKELAKRATLRYGLPRKLAPILESSGRWGRIKAEIVCSMTSKYAIALYELIQLRANMEKSVETFPIDRFRELLGVPPGTYVRGDNFQRKVLDPAVLEVNGLSDMSLQIELERLHSRAPIHAVTLGWWRKSGERSEQGGTHGALAGTGRNSTSYRTGPALLAPTGENRRDRGSNAPGRSARSRYRGVQKGTGRITNVTGTLGLP